MAIDCSTSELVAVVTIGFFTVLIERPGLTPMAEFDWACIYTSDTLNMLTSESFFCATGHRLILPAFLRPSHFSGI